MNVLHEYFRNNNDLKVGRLCGAGGKIPSSFISNAKSGTKFLGGLSNVFIYGGNTLSVFSAISTETQFQNGTISQGERERKVN